MSVVGLDFGNLSMLVAQCSKGGVDVMLNDSSNRQTATTASIQGKQRFLGDSGAAMVRISRVVHSVCKISDINQAIMSAMFKIPSRLSFSLYNGIVASSHYSN